MAREVTLRAPSQGEPVDVRRRRLRTTPSMRFGGAITLVILLLALLVPIVRPGDPFRQNIVQRLKSPGAAHLLGTDGYGRELWRLILWGAPTTVMVGVGTVLLGGTVGGILGLVGGYWRGIAGEVIMRAMDLLLALPLLVLALAIMAFLGQSLINLIAAVAVVNVPIFARISQATTLQARAQDFVTAARALGASDFRMVRRHVVPNMVAPLIIMGTLRVGSAILLESTLSFLGLGPGQNIVSWGQIIEHGRTYMQSAPWIALAAGGAISLTVLGLNLLGDGLRDLLDPRMKTGE